MIKNILFISHGNFKEMSNLYNFNINDDGYCMFKRMKLIHNISIIIMFNYLINNKPSKLNLEKYHLYRQNEYSDYYYYDLTIQYTDKSRYYTDYNIINFSVYSINYIYGVKDVNIHNVANHFYSLCHNMLYMNKYELAGELSRWYCI